MKPDADKVYLDLSDNPDIKEHFSRKEPGDPCKLEITATLDENANDVAVLSITNVKVLAYDDGEDGAQPEEGSPEEEASESPEEAAAEGDEAPVMKVMKKKGNA